MLEIIKPKMSKIQALELKLFRYLWQPGQFVFQGICNYLGKILQKILEQG